MSLLRPLGNPLIIGVPSLGNPLFSFVFSYLDIGISENVTVCFKRNNGETKSQTWEQQRFFHIYQRSWTLFLGYHNGMIPQ